MIRVLFICHGNICRSTMAEYVMKDLVKKANLESSFYIDSAGTSNEEDGNPVHYGTQNKLREEGIPCGNHRARQMTESMIHKYAVPEEAGFRLLSNAMERLSLSARAPRR